MTYVTEQTSAQLRAHMTRLKAMSGWHEPLADRLYAEIVMMDSEIDRLRTQNQALREAVKGFHTWAYGQRKQQSKGGHASFDFMELREQMDIAEAALAQAEGGV